MLLAAALDEREALSGIEVEDMVRRALGFIARTGPATEQDRWEESTGINPFTLTLCIAALVAGADLLPPPASDWALELADFWNNNIERWTAVTGTALAKRLGVSGYYVLVLPVQILGGRKAFIRSSRSTTGPRVAACPVTNWFGIAPGIAIYVYFGIFGKGLGNGPSVFDWMLFGLGVLATIALAILAIRKTKTKFAEENPT